MAFPPQRRQDPGPDYYGPDDARGSRRKSETYRRPRDDYRPSRREPSPGHMRSGGRRPRSPPPHFAPDPPRREPPSSRHDRDRYPRDEYARDRHHRDYPPPEPRDRRYRAPENHRAGRPRHASPEPKHRSRGYPTYDDRDGPDQRSSRRSRGAPPQAHNSDGEYDRQRRRHRSQPRDADADRSRARSRPPRVASRSPLRRRSTMPASTKAAAAGAAAGTAAKPKGPAWWKNPLVQAGARTALTAGAQAVMQNRKEEGPWFGAKGAKVATAALGAALADGFMGGDKKRH